MSDLIYKKMYQPLQKCPLIIIHIIINISWCCRIIFLLGEAGSNEECICTIYIYIYTIYTIYKQTRWPMDHWRSALRTHTLDTGMEDGRACMGVIYFLSIDSTTPIPHSISYDYFFPGQHCTNPTYYIIWLLLPGQDCPTTLTQGLTLKPLSLCFSLYQFLSLILSFSLYPSPLNWTIHLSISIEKWSYHSHTDSDL